MGAVSAAARSMNSRPHNADHDHRGGPTLEDFADLLADPQEGIEPLLLHLGRQQHNLHTRQMLRQRGPPVPTPLVLADLLRLGGGLWLGLPRLGVEQHLEHLQRQLCVGCP
jgi:hypothetical protein